MDYDIFINYRREGGQEFARPLASELEKRGYRVFLDFDELKDGRFDKRIMDAIDSAPIFISILSQNCLDRCVNTDDWVRQEIEYAFEHEKHIIPVNPNQQFKSFPETTPDKIRQALGQHQFSEIMMGMLYKASMDKMVNERIVPILGQRNGYNVYSLSTQQGLMNSVLKVETDLDCHVYVDGEERGTATADVVTRIPLRGGSYRLRFVAVDYPNVVIEEKRFHIDRDTEEWYSVVMMPQKNAEEERRREEKYKRELEEKIRKEYLLQLPDNAFIPKVGSEGWHYVDKEGKELFAFDCSTAFPFSEGLALVKKKMKYGFIDKTGNEIIPCIYDYAFSFCEGLANVRKDGKWGCIDKIGIYVFACIYDCAISFSEGLAAVNKNGKWGFIDKIEREVIPFIYDSAGSFSEGLARVKKNGKFGYIDKTGKEVIPSIYIFAWSFTEGLAAVKQNGNFGFIDKTGKEIIPFIRKYLCCIC